MAASRLAEGEGSLDSGQAMVDSQSKSSCRRGRRRPRKACSTTIPHVFLFFSCSNFPLFLNRVSRALTVHEHAQRPHPKSFATARAAAARQVRYLAHVQLNTCHEL